MIDRSGRSSEFLLSCMHNEYTAIACFICLSGAYADQMLKKGVRLFSQQQRETSVLFLGGMSCQNVPKRASLSNQRWATLCFSGACGLMLLWIHRVCMVLLFLLNLPLLTPFKPSLM